MEVNAGVELEEVLDEDAILTIQVQATKSRYIDNLPVHNRGQCWC